MAFAKEKDLAAIAICDHDCVDGIQPCHDLGVLSGVEVVPGIELTVEKDDTEIHFLGYCIDWQNQWLQKKLKDLQQFRINRINAMIAKLKEQGIEVSPQAVFQLSGRGSVGRLHLARVMLQTGKIASMDEAFRKYIGFLKPCYVKNIHFSPREAIETILKVGGVPVLAHPRTLRNDGMIPDLIDCGLRGIEAYHTDHDAALTKRYEAMAKRYNILVTGGSDCHGLGKGRVLMGGVKVPYEILERLREAALFIKGSQAAGR